MNLFRKATAEFIGTFALVFSGCGSIMVIERFPQTLSPYVVPVVFGLVVAAMIYALGHISGAHFNPAVTFAFTVVRHLPARQMIVYFFAQFLGGLFALALLSTILPSGELYGATIPHVGFIDAWIWEVTLSFFLMFVIMAVATDTRAVGMLAGVAIGATVMFCAFVGGPVTGASMNPARSLAPAIFENQLSTFWIYLTGPMSGAALAAFVYKFIRCEKDTIKNAEGCC